MKSKEGGLKAPLPKNGAITNFFKPFAKPLPSKRARDETDAAHPAMIEERRSKSPRLPENPRRSTRDRTLSDVPSSSTLSSLGSDETIEAPSEIYRPSRKDQTATLPAVSSQSLVSSDHTLPSSQRVTRNGEVMIKNSDGESDSDSSLEDPDELLRSYRNPNKSSPLTEPDLPHRASLAQRVTRSMNSSRKAIPKELPALPKYKFSLGALIANAKKDDAAEAEVERALHLAKELDRKRATLEEVVNGNKRAIGTNAEELASMMKNEDSDDISRLVQAIQRTEALQFKKSWYFLEPGSQLSKTPKFPSCQGHPLGPLLADAFQRDALFISGYLGDIAANKTLPDEIFEWILDSAPLELRDDFRSAGLAILKDSRQKILSLSEPARVERLFRGLGLSDQALNIEQSVKPILCDPKEEDLKPRNWGGLEHVLRVIGCVAQW